MAEPHPGPSSASSGGPEGRWTLRSFLGACAVLVLALGLGVGAYLIGARGGADLDQARGEGVAAGAQIGAAQGDRRGYRDGYELGRRASYAGAYRESYRAAYQAAFREVGVDTPDFAEIEIRSPGAAAAGAEER